MKNIATLVIISIFAVSAAFAQNKAPDAPKAGKHDCADCPMHKKMAGKKCGGMTCPEKIKGAETVSRNIENGVEVTTTGRDKETVARIQELALVHYGPKAEKCPGCPTKVAGAETKVANIDNGIKVTITGKTPEVVKQIQEASAAEHAAPAAALKGPAKARAAHQMKKEAAAAGKYVCPMGDYEGDKPGKCPKCGMELKEKK